MPPRWAHIVAQCIVAGLALIASSADGAPLPAAAAAEIDRLIEAEALGGAPQSERAPRTSDELFLRRVYLDLVGQLPTPNEITLFVLNPAPDKRAKLVQRLLTDPRYGTNWAHYWRDVILYRRSAEQVIAIAGALEPYLADQFNHNTRWDEIAQAFVQAKGSTLEHGETGLFVAQLAEPVDVAAEMSRIFLGVQIQCAECHDHPTERWKREQFHEFVAFFPRVGVKRMQGGGGRPSIELASFDNGPLVRRPAMFGTGAQEHFMPDLKDPSSRGKLMAPVFFATGQRLPTGSTDDERRSSLAHWMTSSKTPWFAKAVVNRLWFELIGEGFCEPIDDLGPEKSCVAPRTFDYLAAQFVEHGYDLKWLLATIVATDTYQRESRPRRTPDQPAFAANVPQRLRADQLADVLTAALGSDLGRRGFNGPPQPYNAGPRGQFNQLFGYDPSLRRSDVSSSIPQALFLMNSPQLGQSMSAQRPDTYLGRVAAGTRDDESAIVEMYLRCLAREPNERELKICREHIAAASGRAAGLEDIFWALLNCEEIRYRN